MKSFSIFEIASQVSNIDISLDIALKVYGNKSESKLTLSKYNKSDLSKTAFRDFTLHSIKQHKFFGAHPVGK